MCRIEACQESVSSVAVAPGTFKLQRYPPMHRSYVCHGQQWRKQIQHPRPHPTAYFALQQRQLRGQQVCPCCGGVCAPPKIHAKVHTYCRRPLLSSPCTGSGKCPCCAVHVQQQDPLADCNGLKGCDGHQSLAAPSAVLVRTTGSALHAHAVLRSGFSCAPDRRRAPPSKALPGPDSKGLGLRVGPSFNPCKADAQDVLQLGLTVPFLARCKGHVASETIEEGRHEPGLT